jgi:hypothetical protein
MVAVATGMMAMTMTMATATKLPHKKQFTGRRNPASFFY